MVASNLIPKLWLLIAPFLSLVFCFSTLMLFVSNKGYAMSDKVGEGIQLIQKGQLHAARARLMQLPQPHEGEALFLAARIAEHQHQWSQALQLYRQYLSQQPFSVHALEARASFALIRTYQNDPLLKEFLYLVQLRDRYALDEMQAVSAKIYHQYPKQKLAIRGQLLVAYCLLEAKQDAQGALHIYKNIAQATRNMKADWYIQALFGAMFAAIRMSNLPDARHYYQQIENQLNSQWGSQNSLLARSWQQRLNAMQFLITDKAKPSIPNTPLLWGVGARLLLDSPSGSNQNYRPIWQHLAEQQMELNSVTLWITKDSDWRWLRSDLLQGAHSHGYVPMINYWYFGDKISPQYVTQHRDQYLSEVKNKLIPLIQDLPAAYLILEPEFNKQGIESWDGWDPLMLEVIALIRQHAPQIKVGLGLGDWDQPGSEPSYISAEKAIEASDFVASMLMLSSYTERAHADPDWSAWIRVLRLGDRLKRRFNKPWMLAYLSIASEPNWQSQQANELDKLHFYLPLLRQQGLFALNWFSLTDEPNQQGWFADAEQSFGLLDAHYQKKPAFSTFDHLVSLDSAATSDAQLLVFKSTPVGNHLQFSATLSHWSPWKVTLRQGDKIWQKQGTGENFSFLWHGQMLPNWCTNEIVKVDIEISGVIRKQQIIHCVATQINIEKLNQDVSLNQWQTWLLLPKEPIHQSFLGKGSEHFIELILNGIDTKQLSSLRIGLKDAQGFSQTLYTDGYAYTKNEQIAIHLPLSEFRYPWVRFINGQPIWRSHPSRNLAIVIENTAKTPLRFKVLALNMRQR